MDIDRSPEERFAARIKTVRAARGLSAQKLADLTGMDRRVISKIENGVRGIALHEAIVLAAGLEVPLKDMYSPGPVRTRVHVAVD